jgi:spore maturation protein CgeB
VDIMASNALLITHRSTPSDLHRIFGADCPVPTYGDLDELERLCAHYLANEDERRALVKACNALVRDGFSFRDRALDLVRLAGLSPPDAGPAVPAPALRWVDLAGFSA